MTVLTTDRRLPEVAGGDEENVRRELHFYWADHEILRPSLSETLQLERHNQRALARAIDEVKPDVVSAWHMGAMSLSLLSAVADREIPLVLVVCDDWLLYAPSVDRWTGRLRRLGPLAKVAELASGVPATVRLPDATAFCFVSEWIRQRAIGDARWPMRRTTLAYSGIERGDFRPGTDDAEWTWRLLCVGRVEERKGVHHVVEALPLLPEARLDIVGPPHEPYVERIRRRAAELGVQDRISFDSVPRSALAARYQRADVFVFPVQWEEPFGLVPLEAMACGTPVIATCTGGSAEFLVDGVNCVRIPPGDPDAIVTAVKRLADDPSLRAHIVQGGIRTADLLDTDEYAALLERWHVAAARRFTGGAPPDEPPIGERIAAT